MADYQQMYLERHGHRLGYHRYRRDSASAVIMLPAMGVPAGYYDRFATTLAGSDCDVTVADLRGTGKSRPRARRAVDFGYADLIGDVDELLRELSGELTGRRILLVGHSLGGQLTSLYLAGCAATGRDTALPIDAFSLVACGIPYHGLYGRYSPMLYLAAGTLRTTARLRGHWPGYGFGGRQPRRLISEWAHTVHKGSFIDFDGIDLDAAFAQVSLPLLAVTVDTDRYTPPRVSRRLTDKFTGCAVTDHHYTRAEAGAELDHFKWARSGTPLAHRLRAFLDAES